MNMGIAMRKIHGPVRNQNGQQYERRKNDLERSYNRPNMRLFLKTKQLDWPDHVWWAEESLIRHILTRNPAK